MDLTAKLASSINVSKTHEVLAQCFASGTQRASAVPDDRPPPALLHNCFHMEKPPTSLRKVGSPHLCEKPEGPLTEDEI